MIRPSTEHRLYELRKIEGQYSYAEMVTFLKSFAGAASNAITEEWSWESCILAGHIAVSEFGPDKGLQ
jgi:hypothetical protein